MDFFKHQTLNQVISAMGDEYLENHECCQLVVAKKVFSISPTSWAVPKTMNPKLFNFLNIG